MKTYLRTNGSVGEQMIESILLENGINYKREYTFKNALGNNQRMDFLVYFEEIFYCIEYHGVQHYKETTWFGDSLETIQKRDKLTTKGKFKKLMKRKSRTELKKDLQKESKDYLDK